MFPWRDMSQDINDMKFCESCKMNVFPSRPKFNTGVFLICMLIILPFVMMISVIFFSAISELLIILFFLWGFMIINPYLIIYAIKKKRYCPNCYRLVIAKNLDFYPFGEKEPGGYGSVPNFKNFSKFNIKKKTYKLFCPYCGNPIALDWMFCIICGKKNQFKV